MPLLDFGAFASSIAPYAGLFFAALAAATLLPLQSEALLVGLLLAGYSPWLLLIAASAGNILGSTINWAVGRGMHRLGSRHNASRTAKSLKRAEGWYRRYGKWSLLLSWLPVVGDPLTVIAGLLREPLPTFLLLVGVGKAARYLALVAGTVWWA
ncbi:MAG: hypothetical protein ABS35_18880 [Kaistia sp. SCN 65-12]|nr:MAG: hypothetical protein ABS35_18880 [Kaistia sp. SCN 65-12]